MTGKQHARWQNGVEEYSNLTISCALNTCYISVSGVFAVCIWAVLFGLFTPYTDEETITA